jgi:hypothetical protein
VEVDQELKLLVVVQAVEEAVEFLVVGMMAFYYAIIIPRKYMYALRLQ